MTTTKAVAIVAGVAVGTYLAVCVVGAWAYLKAHEDAVWESAGDE